MSEFEKLYDEYLKDAERIKEIDGVKYYKIIDCCTLNARGKMVIITVPNEAIHMGTLKCKDETGKVFEHCSPAMISFMGALPKWYLKCAMVMVKDVYETI